MSWPTRPSTPTRRGPARSGGGTPQLAPIVGPCALSGAPGTTCAAARELAAEDAVASPPRPTTSQARDRASCRARLRELLLPRDPNDDKDVILEVKAGEGGEESALFAGDLLRMYLRYAERQGWRTEILDAEPSRPRRLQGRHRRGAGRATGGRVGQAEVRGRRAPRAAGAGHRVAGPHPHLARPACWCCPRPRTSRSRSTPTTCASTCTARPGPGGQSVNTTDSAVRITHVPDRHRRVSCQNEKSQLQNKEAGLRVLRARLLAAAQEEADADAADARRSQVRTVDRSERVRTYNFPENRITDHRVGFKAYNLDQVLDGDLDAVIDGAARADTERAAGRRAVSVRGTAGRRPRRRAAASRGAVRRARRGRRVASPRVDAEQLAAHVLGVPRGRLVLAVAGPGRRGRPVTASWSRAAGAASRCSTSSAARRSGTSSSPSGPGCSSRGRRPSCSSTAADRLARRGAAAASSSTCAPGRARSRWRWPTSTRRAGCIAVEADPGAARLGPAQHRGRRVWPSRLLAGRHRADACRPTSDGAVDVVVSNPPYVAATGESATTGGGAARPAGPALFAGAGRARRHACRRRRAARRLLRPGGSVVVEHDDSQGPAVAAAGRRAGRADSPGPRRPRPVYHARPLTLR